VPKKLKRLGVIAIVVDRSVPRTAGNMSLIYDAVIAHAEGNSAELKN
jgi:hypothetical protein